MNFNNLISNIHWIPVILVTILTFVIGFLWHQPFLFGKTWKRENNPNDVLQKINAPKIFGGTAVLHFIAIMSLSALVSGKGGVNGLLTGFLISFVWVLPAMGGTYLFANRSVRLLAIDSGMYILLFSLSGFILGLW